MDIIYINDKTNIGLLKQFISKINSNFFRYFSNRTFECIKHHKHTVLGILDKEPVGYGHLDFENDICWLGICILDEYHSNGYGKKIIDILLDYYNKNLIEFDLCLAVDNDNHKAIKFYEKNNFVIIEKLKYSFKMKYIKND